jgi:DNA-binding NarL/FixJ family response regulator
MSTPIRVLIADDQKVVREGLAMVLGLLRDVEVVGAASDGDEAVTLAGDLHPDVVLMDLRMPRCDGVEATRILRERQPGTKVVVLTTYADDRSVLDALRAGAGATSPKTSAGQKSVRHSGKSSTIKPSLTRQCNVISSKPSPAIPRKTPRHYRAFPTGSRPVRPKYFALSPPGSPTPRSPNTSSSARARSRATSTGCS